MDETAGTVTFLGEGTKSLMGATFKFSGFEDLPFNEAELDPSQYAEALEANFPDGSTLLFAREWDVG